MLSSRWLTRRNPPAPRARILRGDDADPSADRGELLTPASPDLAAFLARPHRRVVLDLGCGDARATARMAAHEPDSLIVGLDANLDAAERVARRARRAPEKGGLPNLALILAPADRLPAELDGRVDEVRIELPWGSLLEGLMTGQADLLDGVRRVLAQGGHLRVVLNARALPAGITPDEAAERLGRAFERIGLADVDAGSTAIAPETGWGKRLAVGRPLSVVIAEGTKPRP
jgi:SAM-dependent methyltransferase